MSNLGTANFGSVVELGNGAQFWAYLSPENETSKMIRSWKVTISQGNWSDSITNENPSKQIQTNGLSGNFNLNVEVLSGSTGMWQSLLPVQGSTNEIGCNSNCASMVGIVADSISPPIGSINAKFWTTWDAMCSTK
ncbi:hypothetical protein [Flavobacterium sp.]|uniref:hypothetical protein n=1 Tax=Flavobacterium sp. TaxID=239 RepID=UPI00375244DC